ncbi:TAP-like protein [Streptomyces sp. TLI_053]|uniref:alpha/beta hydrolase n=1 Tax=Streptomyces sp. TLI_053 TaxID=1855352 RepID=UPI0008799043|nr:alpha/beta hydrolase [Streptomyces sp. TLI_053]SDT01128.1 TAP-like protein [Streptomyces sp. TLI_053]
MTTRDLTRTSTPSTGTSATGTSTTGAPTSGALARRVRRTGPGRRTAALLTLLALASTTGTAGAVAAPTGAAAAVPTRYAHQQLTWQTCAEEATLECTTMTAPRDWHHPGRGPDITVAVSRHRATDPARRIGTLLTAAGGPGGEGLLRPADHVRNAPALGASYDIIGFDQRGVGHSTRAVCRTTEELRSFFAGDFRDDTPADRARVIAGSAAFAADCEQRSGGLLPFLTTEQTARDIDLLRALLGERRISYYGPSYATMIGAYYATLFPHRIERMVLDSNIGFDDTWERFQSGQPMSFQRRFEEDFLPWLAARDGVYHYGTTPAEAKAHWEARRAALHEHPIVDGRLTLGPNQLDNGTIQGIYRESNGFAQLATALTALDDWPGADPAARTTARRVFGDYLGPGFLAEYFAVTCSDTPWDRDLSHWAARGTENTARWPLVGARTLAFAAVCASWPTPTAPRVRVTGAGLPPTLMLNSVHDPATYYEAALSAHRALSGSRLVTVTGNGDHGQYPGPNACVRNVVESYLLTGAAPADDLTCPSPTTS